MSPETEDQLFNTLSQHCCHHGWREVASVITRLLMQIDREEVLQFIQQLDYGFSRHGEHPRLSILKEVASYKQAVEEMVTQYKQGADSGDWGFWELEEQPEVMKFREAEENLNRALSSLN